MASFWKPEACGQILLLDRSILVGQKLVENAKIQKFKCDIFGWFSNTVVMFFSNFSLFCNFFFEKLVKVEFLINSKDFQTLKLKSCLTCNIVELPLENCRSESVFYCQSSFESWRWQRSLWVTDFPNEVVEKNTGCEKRI